MLTFKLLAVAADGLLFAILALGLMVAFQWLRFPDLTPDGSFIAGAATFVLVAPALSSPLLALAAAALIGAGAGVCTALINFAGRVPTVVAGLLTSASAYSIVWLCQGRPNRYLPESAALFSAGDGLSAFVAYVGFVTLMLFLLLFVFARTAWGMRLRALGENPRLARDLRTSELLYTVIGLGIGNGVVGLAGGLFVQRSFASDINMGNGITITGLAGMMLGMLFARPPAPLWRMLFCVILGAVAYRAALFGALEIGLPAEAFRLASSLLLVAAFVATRWTDTAILRTLRWT